MHHAPEQLGSPEYDDVTSTRSEQRSRQRSDLPWLASVAGNGAVNRLIHQSPAGGAPAVPAGPAEQIGHAQQDADAVANALVGKDSVPSVTVQRVTLQRDPLPGPPPPAQLPPEQQRHLLVAAATLRDVEPLAPAHEEALRGIIPATPIFDMLKERDVQRAKLAKSTAILEQMRRDQAHPPENGAPPTHEMTESVANEVDFLASHVNRLNGEVQIGLKVLGIKSEHELTDLVTEKFPALFLARAKQIALTELAHNQKIVETETDRYGLKACVDPAARQALVGAARDLVQHDQRIAQLNERLTAARQSDLNLPPGGVPDPAEPRTTHQDVTALEEQVNQASAERDRARKQYAMQHPILLRDDIDLAGLAAGDDASFDRAAGGPLRQIAKDIDKTKENIESGRLKPWNLTNIVDITNQDLGVGDNPVLQTALRDHITREQKDEAMVAIAVAALGITAGIVATFASGGLAAGAAVVMIGTGAATATASVRDYLAKDAASNVAIDPAIAKLSAEEPELEWVLLDLVAVGLEAVMVVRTFKAIAPAARAFLKSGKLLEFAKHVKQLVSGESAKRIILTASRRTAIEDTTDKIILALQADKSAFTVESLMAIKRQLEKVVEEGWAKVFQHLTSEGRVLPLTQEALEKVLGKNAAEFIMIDVEDVAGFYTVPPGKPEMGHLFLQHEASVETVGGTVIHETTHYLQQLHKAKLDKVSEEVQAWMIEREYAIRLERLGGDLSEHQRNLIDLSDATLVSHISEGYGAPILRNDYKANEEIAKVMEMVRTFKP